MAYWDDDLQEQVQDKLYKKLGTREDIIAHYKEEYPGEKVLKNGKIRYEWKEKLTDKIMEENPGAKRASVSRRFQRDTKTGKDRYEVTRASKSQQAEYKALGEKIGPIPPKTVNYTVRVHGAIRISQWCRDVDFTVTISSGYSSGDFTLQGSNADDFTDEPNVEALVLAYWHGDDPGYEGWCEGPYITVEDVY